MKGAKVTRRKTLCKLKDLLNIAQNDLVLFISVSVNLFFLLTMTRFMLYTIVHIFRPAKGSPKKSKKPGNVKETRKKCQSSGKTNSTPATENTTETKYRKPKTSSVAEGSTSAEQTAAG